MASGRRKADERANLCRTYVDGNTWRNVAGMKASGTGKRRKETSRRMPALRRGRLRRLSRLEGASAIEAAIEEEKEEDGEESAGGVESGIPERRAAGGTKTW